MEYYTVAKIVSQVHGHGDSSSEFHICPRGHDGEFPPIFKTPLEADAYLDGAYGLKVVSLRVFSSFDPPMPLNVYSTINSISLTENDIDTDAKAWNMKDLGDRLSQKKST